MDARTEPAEEAASDVSARGPGPEFADGGHLHDDRAFRAADGPLGGDTETVCRAAIYLAAVSSGLVALAFTGQLSRLGAAFYVFALVLLPTLIFVGLTTFDRALHNAVEDVQLAGRINRIRQFYFDAAPQVARYLPPPGGVSPWEIARQAAAGTGRPAARHRSRTGGCG